MRITLRFVTDNDLVSRAIRAFEGGFWASHVEAVMPDGTYLGAHFKGGVLARPASYDKISFTREMFVNLPVTDLQESLFYDFLRKQVGKKYDLTAIEGLVLERDWTKPDEWFCSELQAAALSYACWFDSNLAANFSKITPRDLLLIISGRVKIS